MIFTDANVQKWEIQHYDNVISFDIKNEEMIMKNKGGHSIKITHSLTTLQLL